MPILVEPTWGNPTKSYDDKSALCIIRPTPTVVTGILLQLIRAQFVNADNIVDPKLREYLWVDDDTEGHEVLSKVQIEPSYKVKMNIAQQRPSILVTRGKVSNTEFLINDGPAAFIQPGSGNYEGKEKYCIIEGEHYIESVGRYGMEADRLAEEVFFRMLEYKSVIKTDLNFSEFDVTLLDRLEKVDENHEHYKAVITIKWKFVYSWRLAPVAPVLKQIGQSFNVF